MIPAARGVLNILLHGVILWSGEVVETAVGKASTRLQVYGTVVEAMRWQRRGMMFAKDWGMVMILYWDQGEVGGLKRNLCLSEGGDKGRMQTVRKT